MTRTGGEIRVAVVGVGHRALRWAKLLEECPRTAVSLVASTPGRPEDGGAPENAAEDWRQAVRHSGVDAVLVCTPVDVRPEVSIAAMEAGKHVLCDQPIAADLGAAYQIVETARRCQVVLFGSSRHRHRRAVTRVQEWITDGIIGEPMTLRCRFGPPVHLEEVDLSPAEVLGEQTVWGADLARWLLGHCEAVIALDPPRPTDMVVALLQGSSGRVTLFESCLLADAGEFSVEVLGHEGYAYARGSDADGRERAAFARRDPRAPFRETRVEFVGADLSAVREWRQFADAVRARTDTVQTVGDAIAALRLLVAIRQSARLGLVVDVFQEGCAKHSLNARSHSGWCLT